SAGPELALAGVWARRPEAAQALAAKCGAEVAPSFETLLERCEAVAFSVPPDVQAALGVRAAAAGKHLMLDKPLAIPLADAQRLVRAIEGAGVVSQLMLTQRYRPSIAAFLEGAREYPARAARMAFLSSAFVRGPYVNSWRKEHGALHDLGPHAFDLLE